LERYQIWELDGFWAWVMAKTRRNSRLYIVSHNLNVDMVVTKVYEYLPKAGFTQRSFYVKGMTTIIRFRRKNCTIMFLDNANWWKVSVEALGDMVGYPKLAVDPLSARLDDLIPYCERDVRILYEVWKRWIAFLDEHDLGNFGITISSQALKTYTHRFMPYPIFMHTIDPVIDLERASYRGGRVEPFWIGDWEGEQRYKLDVNSMYPYVMRNNRYPTKLVTRWWKPSKDRIYNTLREYLIIAQATLDTDIPAYCMTGKHGAHYPVGEFRTTLTTPELRFALKNGHVQDIGWVAVYEGERIFTEYVNYFYDLKLKYTLERNHPYREMAKYMLNTLYGKFGQRGIDDKVTGECDPDIFRVEPYIDAQTGEMGVFIYAGGQVIRRIESKVGYNSFVAIASHVTAYARMYLWDLIVKGGRENVLYCDTDSLVVLLDGYRKLGRLTDPLALGALKVEAIADHGYIYGKKDYAMGEKRVLKGIPRKATPIGEGAFAFDMWPTMKGLLRKGDLTRYYIVPTVRRLKRNVTWGWADAEGRVHPHHLPGPLFEKEKDDGKEYELSIALEGMLQARKFPQTLLLTVWNFQEGQLRKGVDDLYTAPHYKGIPLDKIASEYGYHDYSIFLEAIEAQVRLNQRIRDLRSQLRSLD